MTVLPGDYMPPTDEQLGNFVRAIASAEARRRGIDINPTFAAEMVLRSPSLKGIWLTRHREAQEAIRGA